MKHPLLLGAALGAALALALPAVLQAEEEQTGDLVVARVDGTDVTRAEVMALARNLPAQYQAQAEMLFPMLLDRRIDMLLIGNAASDDGLANDDEVAERLESLRLDIMREVYLERLIDKEVTDARVKARYDTFLSENPAKAEINARHILLESEEEAREVIAELDGGADFAELARNRSTGPSSAQGGDLGYFTADQMVPEFSQAAFALEPGSHSKDPVQTQFGWHVIKVEDKRTQEPPSFEELEDEMKNEVTRDVVASRIGDLRETAEIEMIAPAGKPAAPAGDSE
ncbi:MAG: peptidylprolyl isomerase [Kiloniellales bacterium]